VSQGEFDPNVTTGIKSGSEAGVDAFGYSAQLFSIL